MLYVVFSSFQLGYSVSCFGHCKDMYLIQLFPNFSYIFFEMVEIYSSLTPIPGMVGDKVTFPSTIFIPSKRSLAMSRLPSRSA